MELWHMGGSAVYSKLCVKIDAKILVRKIHVINWKIFSGSSKALSKKVAPAFNASAIQKLQAGK